MTSLLVRVKSKMFIASFKKALHALEGQYVSMMRGRSMDFEDLREYAVGDNVKDIDWKASARHQTPLIKQYIATRKQPVIFVVDSGLNMNAVTDTGELKKDLAITTVGVLGYLAIRHSDMVSMILGDADKTIRFDSGETEAHLERLLQNLDKNITMESKESNILKQLKFLKTNIKSRALVVVIADETPHTPEITGLLKRLQAQHEVLWVSLLDGNPLDENTDNHSNVKDIESNEQIPEYIRRNKKLKALFEAQEFQRKHTITRFLNVLGISTVSINSSNEIVIKLLKLLERRLRGRHR